jgi:hypothetical protein
MTMKQELLKSKYELKDQLVHLENIETEIRDKMSSKKK